MKYLILHADGLSDVPCPELGGKTPLESAATSHLDDELDPSGEPKSSRAWLAAIDDAERVFKDYHSRADSIDKRYADPHKLAGASRDREM